MVKLGLRF